MQADTNSITHEEWYRTHGTLSDWRIRELLDSSDFLENVDDAETHIREAMDPVSAEDFLSEAIDLAAQLEKGCRGGNKDTATELVNKLREIAQETLGAMEYSKDELKKALDALGSNVADK